MLIDFIRHNTSDGFGNRKSIWNIIHLDPWLLLGLVVLCAFGSFVLYSASGGDWDYVYRQGVRYGIGFVGLMIIAQFDPRIFQELGGFGYVVGIGLLVAVMITGMDAKGAQRWLEIPGLIRFQPSEIMKIMMPVVLAWYLSRHGLPPKFRHLLVAVVLLVIPVGLIVQQPDLGTSLLIGASGIFVIFLAGMSWRLIASMAVLAICSLPVLWIFGMRDYQKQRVLTMFNPESDPLGSGWNIIQSMTAIGSGGLQGKGFMQGTQSQLDFLPESHTDFIIAVLSEEFGFVGVISLLAIYTFIVVRALVIALNARDSFCRLLAGSLALTFFIYIFVNIGMVSGILPVVGVPLPLVSYGGTSIVTLLASFGILMSIATHHRV